MRVVEFEPCRACNKSLIDGQEVVQVHTVGYDERLERRYATNNDNLTFAHLACLINPTKNIKDEAREHARGLPKYRYQRDMIGAFVEGAEWAEERLRSVQ